ARTRRSRGGRKSASQEDLTVRPAAALDEAFAVRVVVVGDLLATPDPPRRANPDHAVDDVDVGVGTAGMVDVARDGAADAGVNHGSIGQLEAPDVPACDVAALALQALLIRDLFPGVVHDPRVLGNRRDGVDTPTMNLRASLLDHPH